MGLSLPNLSPPLPLIGRERLGHVHQRAIARPVKETLRLILTGGRRTGSRDRYKDSADQRWCLSNRSPRERNLIIPFNESERNNRY